MTFDNTFYLHSEFLGHIKTHNYHYDFFLFKKSLTPERYNNGIVRGDIVIKCFFHDIHGNLDHVLCTVK